MLCNRCHRFEAAFHLTEISNNVQTELHLCNKCASEIRLDARRQNSSEFFPVNYIDDFYNIENNIICLNCGFTDSEYNAGKHLGCPSCYKYLRSVIKPNLIGNGKKYSGKKPLNYIEVMADNEYSELKTNNNIEVNEMKSVTDLMEELRIAVMEERYEYAAVLRDKIKEVSASE